MRFLAGALLAAALAAAGCGPSDLSAPEPERRAEAVRALAARGRTADLPVLLVVQKDPSPLVRRAAVAAFGARPGPEAAAALGAALLDPDAGVASLAAAALGEMAREPRAREDLVASYGRAAPPARAAIASALERHGVSLREAVEREARALWERNVTALAAGSPAERAGAAEEVGASGRSEAVQKLLPLVDPNRNADPRLLAAAARGLGEAGDWSARPFLEELLSFEDSAVAAAASRALGRLGDPAAADALAAAAGEGRGTLSAAAVEALVLLPEAPEVGLALCDAAARATSPAVAARAAREARRREAGCPLRPFLNRLSGPGAEVALAALGALAPEGAEGSDAAGRIAAFLDAARGDAGARAAAAEALGRLGGPTAAGAVGRRAALVAARWQAPHAPSPASGPLRPVTTGGRAQPSQSEPGAAPARAPAPVLVAPASPGPSPASAGPAARPPAPVDTPAPSAPASVEPPGGGSSGSGAEDLPATGSAPIAPAPPGTGSPSPAGGTGQGTAAPAPAPRPRTAAAVSRDDLARELRALLPAAGRLRSDGAADQLQGLVRDPDDRVRAGALEGLVRLGGPAGLAALESGLGDPSLAVRLAAADAALVHGARAAGPLTRAASGPHLEPEWRAALAGALAGTGSADAVAPLAAALAGPGAPAAAAAFARLGAPAGAPPLAAALSRPEGAHVELVEALAQLATSEWGPTFAALLTSDSAEVRAAAARALGRLRHEPASGRLEALRNDYHGRVRKAAIEALAKLPAGKPRPSP